MKSKSIMAASAMMELTLAQASADPLCSTATNGNGNGNGSPPDGGYLTFTVPANPDDIGNHPVTKTYPPTKPGEPGIVIIQVPTSPPGANGASLSSIPYVTVTTTGGFPSLTGPATTTITPDKPGATGSVIIKVPNTTDVSSSASYITFTTPGDLSPTNDPRISTIPPSNPTDPGTVIVVVPSSQASSPSSVPFVTITTGSTLNPTDNPITSTISPSGSTGSGTVIVEVPPSSSPAGSGSSSTPASFVTRTVTGDDGNGEPSTTTISPTASSGPATVIVEVPPMTNNPSSTSPGDSSSGASGSSGPSSSATQGPSDSAAPPSSSSGTGPSSSVPETSSPSQATTDDAASSTSASAPASSSAVSSDTPSEAPSSTGVETSSPATSPASSSSLSTSDADTSSPANPTTSSPASSAATSAPGSSTKSAPSSSTSAAAANFDPCSDSLYGNPECCSLDVLGVADVECDSPTESPTDAADFQAICAASSKRARCCVLPVLLRSIDYLLKLPTSRQTSPFHSIILIGGLIVTALIAFLSIATQGYETISMATSNPNTTSENRNPFSDWPSFLTANTKSLCSTTTIPISAEFYTNNTALKYTVTKIWRGDNPTEPDTSRIIALSQQPFPIICSKRYHD
ncbi:hypothetical protein FAGAP_9256 [Fusarium agapanthi]|uniref:Uncharacterized protein n=1 Tax=Fusarium agapanthi TaxID=1803897 RepID=A0A9P5E9A4_9HYPO|nr:hypothetical protein FAGAP_9256 [Fusarium agapanthi]